MTTATLTPELEQARHQSEQDRAIREQIEDLDFVEAMVTLGYIKDDFGIIDGFFKGLIGLHELKTVEQNRLWAFETAKVRAVLEVSA